VGLWAAQRDRRSVWALPIAFVAFMAVGFVLGAGGVAMPAVELGIAASVLVLGIAVALAARIPTVGAVALVALFALFHGHAHGAELPAGMAASLFGAGFATSTALLHGAGISLGGGLRVVGGAAAWAGHAARSRPASRRHGSLRRDRARDRCRHRRGRPRAPPGLTIRRPCTCGIGRPPHVLGPSNDPIRPDPIQFPADFRPDLRLRQGGAGIAPV